MSLGYTVWCRRSIPPVRRDNLAVVVLGHTLQAYSHLSDFHHSGLHRLSRSGSVAAYVFDIKPTELAHSCLFCSCVCFCLYGPFNCISFHKFSRQLSAFSLCSSGPISALLVLSTICLFLKVSFGPSPDVILCG